MPAPSTRWPRGCWSWASAGPPGCCATSASSRRRTRRPGGWARRPTRWTPTARSCGRPRSTSSLAEVERACASLVGESMQTPPAYSAVKVGGRKLYEAARRGEVLEAPARPIRVDAFDGDRASTGAISRSGSPARAGRTCGCSSPTSVGRSAAGRTWSACVAPRSGRSGSRTPARPGEGTLQPVERAVEHLPSIRLEPEEARAASHGRSARTRGDRRSLRGVRSGRRARRHLSGRGRDGEARGDPPQAVTRVLDRHRPQGLMAPHDVTS